jgi:hypothetical protein
MNEVLPIALKKYKLEFRIIVFKINLEQLNISKH